MIRDESYVHIGGWMLSRLKLKGNELLVYATIYSFTNGTDEHCYKGSASYLAERCGTDKRNVYRILKKLEEKGYIQRKERIDNGVKFVDYVTPYDKMSVGGSDKMSPHNNSFSDNNSSEKSSGTLPKNKSNSPKQSKQKLGEHWSDGLTLSENIMERLIEYNNNKKNKFSNMTQKGFDLIIKDLKRLGYGTDEGMIAVLQQSIKNGWEGLFEVKGFKPTVNYESDLGAFYNEMKRDYEGLKNKLGVEKFMQLKQKALRYAAENKLL